MSSQLKIIVGATPADTKIFVDDKQIGYIQEISFSASVLDKNLVSVTITFPNLKQFKTLNSVSYQEIDQNIKLLKAFPHVNIILKDIIFE